jgi:hypothetical protein
MTPQNGEPLREYTPEEMAAICAKFKKQFTVEDLIGYIENGDELIPLDDVIAKAEAMLAEAEARKRGTGA